MNAIVAADKNWAIGYKNKLLVSIPADMKFFRQMTGGKVMAAADTFRAGAIDQLVVWGERAGVEVVRGNAGGDPAAVVFDALERAKTEQADVLLVDTAGRLQNKVNLMNELEKIKRVIQRELPEAPQETGKIQHKTYIQIVIRRPHILDLYFHISNTVHIIGVQSDNFLNRY